MAEQHSNGIANFGTFSGGALFRYTTNPIYNAPGAHFNGGGHFDQ